MKIYLGVRVIKNLDIGVTLAKQSLCKEYFLSLATAKALASALQQTVKTAELWTKGVCSYCCEPYFSGDVVHELNYDEQSLNMHHECFGVFLKSENAVNKDLKIRRMDTQNTPFPLFTNRASGNNQFDVALHRFAHTADRISLKIRNKHSLFAKEEFALSFSGANQLLCDLEEKIKLVAEITANQR